MSSKNQKINIDKDVLYNLYVVEMHTSKEISKIFNCTSKCIRNYLHKFNIEMRSMAESVKLERSRWTEEKELARSKKFIETWCNKSDDERNRINKAKVSKANTPEAIEKSKRTKLLRETYKKSKAEDKMFKELCMFLDKNDIVRGHIDERYPFNCDFYIKSKDLFIEYQGHQTHGLAPYDETNKEHLEYSERLLKSGYDLSTFTVRDPNKLKIAKQNNIKLLLIYPRSNSYLLKDGLLKDIGKFNVAKINDLC